MHEASTRALIRLSDIRKFCGTFWGARPRIIHGIAARVVLPLLYYVSEVLVSRGTLRPLERVLRLAEIIT